MSELPSRVSFAARSPIRHADEASTYVVSAVVIVGEAMHRIDLATAVLNRDRVFLSSLLVWVLCSLYVPISQLAF